MNIKREGRKGKQGVKPTQHLLVMAEENQVHQREVIR
jgi:hypothetical protein